MYKTMTVPFECKGVDLDDGTFTGYASTWTREPDSYGDVVDKGAFKKTIKEQRDRIKILWNHHFNEPIGKPDELVEDEKGLLVKGRLVLGVQRAREVLELMRAGVINEMSIGYDTVVEKIVGEGRNRVRHLKEVRLYDVSPVTFAANPDAMIVDVKAIEYAMEHNNAEPVREAAKAMQALLDRYDGKQEPADDEETEPEAKADDDAAPEDTTPEPEDEPGAAKLEAVLARTNAELEGFNSKAASDRIEAAIERMTGGTTDA
jgi:uncharacterized protein